MFVGFYASSWKRPPSLIRDVIFLGRSRQKRTIISFSCILNGLFGLQGLKTVHCEVRGLSKRMLHSCRTGWRRKELQDFLSAAPPPPPFVQVSLVSKENQNSPDRNCNLEQIALNLCVSDELSPLFIIPVSRQSAAFQFHLFFTKYLFISRFPHILSFNASFWFLSVTLAEGDFFHEEKKKAKNKHPWHQFKKLPTSKGQALSEAAECVSSCRYFCVECTERFWPLKALLALGPPGLFAPM